MKYTHLKQIARYLQLPQHQLSKIAYEMVQWGILTSRTGPKGGVRLNKPPEELRLWDIIKPFESDSLFNDCVMGVDKCHEENPCPLHEYWKDARDILRDLFIVKSLADLESPKFPFVNIDKQPLTEKRFNTILMEKQ